MCSLEVSLKRFQWTQKKWAHEILILATKSKTNLRTVSTESLSLSHTDNLRNIVDDEEAEQNLAALLGSI